MWERGTKEEEEEERLSTSLSAADNEWEWREGEEEERDSCLWLVLSVLLCSFWIRIWLFCEEEEENDEREGRKVKDSSGLSELFWWEEDDDDELCVCKEEEISKSVLELIQCGWVVGLCLSNSAETSMLLLLISTAELNFVVFVCRSREGEDWIFWVELDSFSAEVTFFSVKEEEEEERNACGDVGYEVREYFCGCSESEYVWLVDSDKAVCVCVKRLLWSNSDSECENEDEKISFASYE